MLLAIGNKVIYPNQGPCLINSIVSKIVGQQTMTFYELNILHDTHGTMLVPVDKATKIGVRPLLNQSEVERLLDQLKTRSTASTDRKQRVRDNLKLLMSGSAFDLAVIVESLTELVEKQQLSLGERGTLERAKRLLVCEISEVTGETMQEAEDHVDRALTVRTGSNACAA